MVRGLVSPRYSPPVDTVDVGCVWISAILQFSLATFGAASICLCTRRASMHGRPLSTVLGRGTAVRLEFPSMRPPCVSVMHAVGRAQVTDRDVKEISAFLIRSFPTDTRRAEIMAAEVRPGEGAPWTSLDHPCCHGLVHGRQSILSGRRRVHDVGCLSAIDNHILRRRRRRRRSRTKQLC